MKSGDGEVYRSEPKNKKADCTMIMDDDVMVSMATGKLNGQQVLANLGEILSLGFEQHTIHREYYMSLSIPYLVSF